MYQESLQVQNEHVIILIHAHIMHQRGSCRKQSTTKTAFSLFDYLPSCTTCQQACLVNGAFHPQR